MEDASKAETVEVEVLVLVDEAGNWEVAAHGDKLKELYEENVGDLDPSVATRVIRVKLTVPLPRPVELVGTVPAEPAGGELAVA